MPAKTRSGCVKRPLRESNPPYQDENLVSYPIDEGGVEFCGPDTTRWVRGCQEHERLLPYGIDYKHRDML